MSKTKIDWCDEVWNPVTGCSKISEGCRNCYAEKMANRLQKMGCKKYANGFKVTCHDEELSRKFSGKGKRIFVNSMSDLFHDDVYPSFVLRILAVIRSNPQHTFIVLTKRAKDLYFLNYIAKSSDVKYQPLLNLWLGVSVENQKAADERIPLLLKTPAALRFVSVEPMLENIDLGEFLPAWDEYGYPVNQLTAKSLDWVICGCESGTNRRPFNADWARSLRDQCEESGVPFFLKQMSVNGKIVHMPELDGQVWNQIPGVNR